MKHLFTSFNILWREYKIANRRIEKEVRKKDILTKAKHEELKGKLISYSIKNKLYEKLVKDVINKVETNYHTDLNTVLYSHKVVNDCYKDIKKLDLNPNEKTKLFAQIMNEVSITMQNKT